MKNIRKPLWFGLAAILVTVGLLSTKASALTVAEIKARTHIVNLEAMPVWFQPNQPIDFVVSVKYDGGTQDGFDVGVFHEGRLVGWAGNKRFNTGMNTFRVRDPNFRGDPGAYIVKIKFRGDVFTQKRFMTQRREVRRQYFTINPAAPFPTH